MISTLDTVVLNKDLPEYGLRKGDLGAVVEIHGVEAVEVEFVLPSGKTKALVTLSVEDVRAINDGDVMSVRRSQG